MWVAEWGFVLPPKEGGSFKMRDAADRLVQIMASAVYSEEQKEIWTKRGFTTCAAQLFLEI